MNNKNTDIKNNNELNENKRGERNIYISAIAILLLAIAGITIIQSKIEKGIFVNGKKILDEKSNEEESCIYITGEVKNEGVVCVDKNDNISEAISKAGGITENANISAIDEKRKVVDGEKLHVISKDNTLEGVKNGDNKNIDNSGSVNANNNVEKININTATKEELDKLEGVGEGIANRIIEYRKTNKFNTIEELKDVSGIGDAKYEKIVENICVE